MSDADNIASLLPAAREIALAVDIFLRLAYEGDPPAATEKFRILPDCDVAAWLMSGVAEPSPPEAPLAEVRSFAMRIGNSRYPHMKLRLSRPPNDNVFVFTVDSHDAMLKAVRGTANHDELEELKRHNVQLTEAITLAWEKAGLLTEHDYLRRKIRQLPEGR